MAGNATIRGVPRQLSNGGAPVVPALTASQIPTIQYSSGSAQALQSFARDMFSMSKQYEDQLDQQVQAEAAVQGSAAGAAGEFEYQDYGTIRGRAFNLAAREAYATTLDTQAIGRLNDIRGQYWNDPDGQKAATESYINGVASELAKKDPAQAAAFRNRNLTRAMPGIEAAKDTVYALTRDQANAALIQNEVALNAEIKAQSADLFSENPERSRAAAQAIGLVQEQYLQIYQAKDPGTGKPLYSAVEIAKAKREFMDKTMTEASLSWFEEQPDKAAAYLKFSSGDFKIQLNDGAGQKQFRGDARAFLKNKTPNHGPDHIDGMKPEMADRLAAMIDSAPPAIKEGLQIGSGFRSVERQRQLFNASDRSGRMVARPGHSQHNHGAAADLSFNGARLDKAPQEVRDWVHSNAGAFGLRFPMDYEPWHIETQEARGGAAPKDTVTSVKVRETLDPTTLDRIDTEMRQRIGFSNQQRDRRDAEETKLIKAQQDLNSFEFFNRAAAPKGITREEITEGVRTGLLNGGDGEKLLKFITAEKPERSDEPTRRLILQRIYDGEDVKNMLFDNADKLRGEDLTSLLALNQTRNVDGDAKMTEDQKFQQTQLDKLLTPDTNMAALDPNRQMRKFTALNEYRRRIQDPDEKMTPEEIARDIQERAFRDFSNLDMSELGGKVRPRFSVPSPGNTKYIDKRQSAIALQKAYDAKQITEAEYRRQQRDLVEWLKLQDRVQANATEKVK